MPETTVLAIGIDAADPAAVRRMIEDGAMPTVASLCRDGHWVDVASPAWLGSGAVWPTFVTGSPPQQHGVYGEWQWLPRGMAARRVADVPGLPVWHDVVNRGGTVGTLDVPFTTPSAAAGAFEVAEWGPHDVMLEHTVVEPAAAAAIVQRAEPHPFAALPPGSDPSPDVLWTACVTGTRRRGDLACALLAERSPSLAVVVFPEVHHAGHALHDRTHGTPELFAAVDREIARLVDAANAPQTVAVFSLHGMRGGGPVPTVLGPLLRSWGYATGASFTHAAPRQKAAMALAAAKRRTPAWARSLYRRRADPRLQRRVARPTMVEPHDWARTQAFALPTDQHGWIRINLAGREQAGIVPAARYDALCDELEQRLADLRTRDGEPVVTSIHRTAVGGAAARNPLPDLVVHWSDSALADPLDLAGGPSTRPDARALTGQHGHAGFCVSSRALAAEASVDTGTLLRRLCDAVT